MSGVVIFDYLYMHFVLLCNHPCLLGVVLTPFIRFVHHEKELSSFSVFLSINTFLCFFIK